MICPTFRVQGFCDIANCPHLHPTFTCDICGVMCRSQEYYNNHLASRKHATAKLANSRKRDYVPMKCTLCDAQLGGPASVGQHINGRAHAVRLSELQQQGRHVDLSQVIVEDRESLFECTVCKITVWHQNRVQHERTSRHRQKERFAAFKATLDEAERDKYGVSVTPSGKGAFDFGIIDPGRATRNFFLSLDNTRSGVLFRSATITSSARYQSSFSVSIETGGFFKVLKGTIKFDSQGNKGQFQDRLELIFWDINSTRRFAIVKNLAAIVGNKEDYELLKPIAPYVPFKQVQRDPIKEFIPGRRPEAVAPVKWVVKLQEYHVEGALKEILALRSTAEKMRLIKAGFMPLLFQAETHASWFHVLLQLEEHQSAIDLQRYDRDDAELETDKFGKFYYLEVPGLEEKRPSVIVGDRFLVKYHGSANPHWWEGYVHRVELSKVALCFDSKFSALKKQKFDVRFCLNRLPLRRMHQALDAGKIQQRLVFPESKHVKSKKPSDSVIKAIGPFDRGVGQNPPQMLAVTAILSLPPGSPPFIVFGPPGTGKTVTIVEAIRQVLHANPSARILACAPSNSAADIIAERLTVLGRSQLFRLNAPSRPARFLPTILEPFSLKNQEQTFCVPKKQELMTFRVIVSTCISSAVPHALGVPAGHFSHVFVDEAGQACEPEALIAIKTMANDKTNLVLSGDPKQLGPIIRSNIAVKFQFGNSLLDRLTAMPIYEQSTMQGITIVNLLRNFRSHPSILTFPNERFYHGLLESRADATITESMLRANFLVKPGFQVMFHSIVGKDDREATSPSFFNIGEAALVKDYVKMLKEDQRLRLKDEHIGVIAPYNAQVGKIRLALNKIKAQKVKVGSVEEFQGQERRVMIISTVRSNLEYVETDITHTLGFVANSRRFNVAMTRAQALLIVIGNPLVLSLDGLWRGFLNYVYNNGGWTGSPIPDWDTSEEIDGATLVQTRAAQATTEQQELLQRITEVVENRNADDDIDDLGDGYQQVERPWREGE